MAMTRRFLLHVAMVLAGSVLAAQTPAPGTPSRGQPVARSAPFWTGITDPEAFERAMSAHLARARAKRDEMRQPTPTRTVENTLQPFDDVLAETGLVAEQAQLIAQTHPDPAMVKRAESIGQQASQLASDVWLDRSVYDALTGLDSSAGGHFDAETAQYMRKSLRRFRLAGVDRDEKTRRRISELQTELTATGQLFGRNIREDHRTVTASSAAELDGLPADFIARHTPDADGRITLTTDYPDSLPVLSYATNEPLRKRMYLEFNNRAYPANLAVLDRLIAGRAELARLLGFQTWADYSTADKMAGDARTVSTFIERVAGAAAPRAAREYEAILARKRQDVAGATSVNAWESAFYAERERKADYAFDSQSVRPYFAYDRVKQGVLDVTGRLFGLTYRRVNVPVWHPSVEAYEVIEDAIVVGRFYFDMHPRPNKYAHAATFPLRPGVAGRELPEAALVCNLPGGQPGDPGLMTHDDVVTLFHEFGHLLHHMFAGRHRWAGLGGFSTEWDFVEAPSQMLEEWTWDPATLATFATHQHTGEPIPAPLVRRMRVASEFGKALGVRAQMMLARLSLTIYDRDPAQVDTTAIVRELTAKYRPYPYVEGTHMQAAFDHLNGYSATYYTYMWSLVIAKDLFGRFDPANLLDPGVARRYRETILAPGVSVPAADMVQHFLGRPFDFAGWERWLNRDEPAVP